MILSYSVIVGVDGQMRSPGHAATGAPDDVRWRNFQARRGRDPRGQQSGLSVPSLMLHLAPGAVIGAHGAALRRERW